jgi:hypothetical protein
MFNQYLSSMDEVISGVLRYGFISIVIQVQCFIRQDVPQSSEYYSTYSFIAKLHSPHVLKSSRPFV